MQERTWPTVYDRNDIEAKGRDFDLCATRIQFILQRMGSANDILDVGCFVGHYTNAFAAAGNRTVGVDVDAEVIAHARRLYPHLQFEQVDAMELTTHFGPEAFDIVVAGEVIEHVLIPSVFVENVFTILSPDRKFVLTTQNSNAIPYSFLQADNAGCNQEGVRAKGFTDA